MPLVPATRRRRICWPDGSRWTSAAATTPNVIWPPRPGPGGAARRCHGSAGWLGEALRAEAAGRPGRMLAACRRGLDVLDEHRLTLGASELRAQATVHGAELAALAQRHAARARRPRLLLTWSERWRATA